MTESTPAVIEWKKAVSSRFPDYVRDLEVSSCGKVKKVPSNYIFKQDHKDCYRCIKRNGKTIYIHHLVAESFIGVRPEGLVLDHIDGDKTNNHVSNLRWISVSENCKKGNKALVKNPDGTVSLQQKVNARHFKENTVRALDSLKEKVKTLEEQNANQQKMIEDAYRAINSLFMMYQDKLQNHSEAPSKQV